MKKLTSVASVLSKLMEIAHWIGAVTFALLLIVSLLPGNFLSQMVVTDDPVMDSEVEVYGFSMNLFYPDGTINAAAVHIFSIGAMIIFSLMAMIFRNVYLSLKTSRGETKFSEGDTPFQKSIIRMIREMGIFSISVPVVGLICSTIAFLIMGAEVTEISVNFSSVTTGILLLCLSQVFAEGMKIRQDVDGLL